MGRTGVPPNITRAECERVLDIIQKDYELRRKEHEQLSKIQEEVNEHAAQRDVLSKRKEFNEKYCILCCSSFNLLFRRKIECEDCRFLVCRACAFWENSSKVWICIVCEKQRFIDAESNAWFYNRIKQRFKLFGAAKVLETHCRKRRTSDSENDSGYGHPNDFKPLLNLFSCSSSHSISSMAETSALEEDDVDDEDAEIHQSVESVVEGLLGCSLDDASVDHMYTHKLYDQIFFLYHGQLVVAVRNLTSALQKSRSNSPVTQNECSPTTTHAALKHLIAEIVRECQNLPDLQLSDCNNGWRDHTENFKVKDSDIFSSYDSLVAAAIINKIVEEAQLKYVRTRGSASQESIDSKKDTSSLSSSSEKPRSSNTEETNEVSADEDFTYIKIPVECVQVEEIEEITREYTDSEDDKFSSVSHQSSGLQSTDDLGIFRDDSEISFPGMSEMPDDGKIPFPEFGRDLVDDADSLEDITTCHPTAVTSWEENWLFRKKKRLPLYSNLKYQLLTYCDEPPYMLIPCPSESDQLEDSLEQDDLSELSESHSVGSLEFSSESGDSKPEQSSPSDRVEKVEYHATESDEDNISADPNVPIMYHENGVSDAADPATYKPDFCSTSHITLHNEQQQQQSKEAVSKEEMSSLILEESPSYIKEELKPTSDNLFDVPTLPGSIAEREHQKWQNAVPLKNNPYSAENISKRRGKSPKSILKDHASSFEEFEKELLDSSDILDKPSDENKLDCGLKSIDVNLYKRDYYVNNSKANGFASENVQEETLSSLELLHDSHHDLIPDEALNSLEEKVYISSGKVFTLENHFKRLERELKDVSLSSNDLSSVQSSLQLSSQQSSQAQMIEDLKNEAADSTSEDERPSVSLPSVKSLATKFNPSAASAKYIKHSESKKPNLSLEKPVFSQTKTEETEKVRKCKPCMKVHSLTARSLSREFRVMARQNIPRPMNRTVSVRPQNSDDALSERDCISPVSLPSPVCGSGVSATPDLAHGYTSDESSTSTNSLPRPKARRHISRSILQRASYWERRAEQGLLSDASVNEEFPAIDINPD